MGHVARQTLEVPAREELELRVGGDGAALAAAEVPELMPKV
jgi:hypothetical protein